MSSRAGTVEVETAGPASPRTRPRPDTRWLLAAAIVAVPIVLLALGAWSYRWMSDDGFINLRIVKQIEAGHGPVFNVGERVEASTSPLWVGALLVADLVTPLRLEWIAVLGGLALTLGGLALVIAGSIRLQPVKSAWWLPAGALVFAALPPVWRFATSGLENGLTFAWLGASFFILAGWARRDDGLKLWHAFVLGLGPLVRPELLLLSVAFLGVVVAAEWRASGWRRLTAILAVAFALPVAYEIFRMGYYGSLVPNSAIAKEASRSYWSFGATYLRQTVIDSYALWVPLVVLLVAALIPLVLALRRDGRTRALLVVGAFFVGGLVLAVYIVRVGGDFMHARLLLPSLLTLLAPVAVVPATKRFAAAALVVPWVFVIVVAIRFPGEKGALLFTSNSNAVTAEQIVGPEFVRQYTRPGVYVPGRLPGTSLGGKRAVAYYGVGAASYVLGPDTYVLDLLGLGDAFTSHLKLDHRAIIAHEKPLPTPWIAARLLPPGTDVTDEDFAKPIDLIRPIDHPDGQPFDARVNAARRALECDRLRDFVETYRAPLTASRFVDNLGAAFSNFGFRIPPEPRDAVRELCAS
jgi:arabinofuranosyltransferase